MTDILTQILETKRAEVETAKKRVSFSQIRGAAQAARPARNFGEALLREKSSPHGRIIAECKSRSPSKGILLSPYDPVALALAYEASGAAAVSVLTDLEYFGGNSSHLIEVAKEVTIPVLRKDFIIDEYQIYEARAWGADSFLLLAGVLDHVQLQYFTEIGRDLGMEPLVESHSSEELEAALQTDCLILGINNRSLKTFSVSFDESADMARLARSSEHPRILVCESGIKTRADIETMHAHGYDAFLIGETLVRSADPGDTLRRLISP